MELEKRSGRLLLNELISSIDQITIVKAWTHFFRKLKESISELVTIFK